MKGPTGPAGTLMAWTVGLVLACAVTEMCTGCVSNSKFTTADWVLQGVFAGEAVVDGLETGPIVKHCLEENPIVGPCGQRVPFWIFGVVAVAAEVVTARVLPPRYRDFWEMFWVGAEGANDYSNWMGGYGPKFP